MRVKLFANLAEEAGRRDIDIALKDNATVESALEQLFDQHPSLRQHVLDEEGVPADHINFLVNGTAIDSGEAALGESLEDDDELAIFPPVTGGSLVPVRSDLHQR